PVNFAYAQAVSGVATCSSPVTLGERAGQSVTGTVTDFARNTSSVTQYTTHIRDTNPTIVASRSIAPNANGWNNTNVTVNFACADADARAATCSTPVTLGEGAGQSVTGNVTDFAGNTASVTQSNINIDETNPTIVA